MIVAVVVLGGLCLILGGIALMLVSVCSKLEDRVEWYRRMIVDYEREREELGG